MATILIKNGRVLDPSSGFDGQADVLIKGERIFQIARDIKPPERMDEFIDASGLVVVPGLIDCHVHLREPGDEDKETLESGTRAAAKGGFTTVICEPNTRPPIDSFERLKKLMERAEETAYVNLFTKAAITAGMLGERLTNTVTLFSHPLVVALSEDGNPIIEKALMLQACRQAARLGIPISPHCEDSKFALEALKKRGGDDLLGFTPRAAFNNEPNYIARDIQCAEEVHARIHISHVSLEESLKIIRAAKARGVAVTCEATPHHLLLSEDFKLPDGSIVAVNPPLRSEGDVKALKAALGVGLVDVIASDHAPHTARDKAAGAPGVIGLETTLGLVLTELVEPGIISLMDAIARMSTNPANIFDLPGGKLQAGKPADITIIDLNKDWIVEPDKFESKSRNCPFQGRSLIGQATYTIVRGNVVMKDGQVIKKRPRSTLGL